jgi:GNAT superfamily N-acetyltransferase
MDLIVTVEGHEGHVRDFEPADEDAVVSLFRDSADWFEITTGEPSAAGDVQSLFYSAPEGASLDGKQVLVLAAADGDVIGLVEAVTGYPGPEGCAVGLFLIGRAHRRRGWGKALARTLLTQAARADIATVTATNPVGWDAGETFLRELGFTVDETPVQRAELVGNRSVGPAGAPFRHARLEVDAAGGGEPSD